MLAKLLFALLLFYEVQCFKYFNTFIEHHDIENAEEIFQEFLKATEMSFTGDKYYERLAVFTENVKIINDMNAKNGSAQFGVTKWSHLTQEEFQEVVRCLPKMDEKSAAADEVCINCDDDDDVGDIPTSKDWRDKLPPVKDQEYCRTCWIFAAVGAIESHYAILNNEVISLSEQQPQDCINAPDGCNRGGIPDDAFKYVKTFGGLMTEKDYPYIDADQTCRANVSKVVAKVSSFTISGVWSEGKMREYVAKTGPLPLGIDDTILQHYHGGILDPDQYECARTLTELNHAVLIVGYSDDTKPHWIIRNSWGGGWGENGYFRVVRDKGAMLIGQLVSSVTVAKN